MIRGGMKQFAVVAGSLSFWLLVAAYLANRPSKEVRFCDHLHQIVYKGVVQDMFDRKNGQGETEAVLLLQRFQAIDCPAYFKALTPDFRECLGRASDMEMALLCAREKT